MEDFFEPIIIVLMAVIMIILYRILYFTKIMKRQLSGIYAQGEIPNCRCVVTPVLRDSGTLKKSIKVGLSTKKGSKNARRKPPTQGK